MPIIHLTTIINAPVNICFDLSRSIDLHKISVEGSNEEAIAGVTSGLIGMGEEVTWRGTHLGIRQTLSSRITDFEYPVRFRDEMIRGIFKRICHDHLFESQGNHTIMKDHFEFEAPCGILGKIANHLFLKKYLTKLIHSRNAIIKKYAESSDWKLILTYDERTKPNP